MNVKKKRNKVETKLAIPWLIPMKVVLETFLPGGFANPGHALSIVILDYFEREIVHVPSS